MGIWILIYLIAGIIQVIIFAVVTLLIIIGAVVGVRATIKANKIKKYNTKLYRND